MRRTGFKQDLSYKQQAKGGIEQLIFMAKG